MTKPKYVVSRQHLTNSWAVFRDFYSLRFIAEYEEYQDAKMVADVLNEHAEDEVAP